MGYKIVKSIKTNEKLIKTAHQPINHLTKNSLEINENRLNNQLEINEHSLTNRLNRFIMGYNIVKPIKPME